MSPRDLLVAALPGLPLLGVLALVLPFLAGRPLAEATVLGLVRRLSQAHLLLAALLLASLPLLGPTSVHLGRWYGDADYALEIVLRLEGLTGAAALVVALVAAVVLRFSERALHREEGHLRYFATLLLALACLDLVVLAQALDLLFVGWELLGLCSFLLIAFFHQREASVARALRAIFSYRVADLGLLAAMILLHAAHTSDQLGGPPRLEGTLALSVGLLLALTAAGKAGLVPFSSWLGTAAEGPTPSTALFYGALSLHAGPWLLLRAWPLYGDSVGARVGLVVLGLVAALSATAHGRTRADIKGALLMRGSAQVGLIVAEIGLGLHTLAALHMLGNIGLRTWQILHAPAAIQDSARAEVPSAASTRLWLLSSEGWFEPVVQRVVGGVVGVGWVLDAASRRVERAVEGP